MRGAGRSNSTHDRDSRGKQDEAGAGAPRLGSSRAVFRLRRSKQDVSRRLRARPRECVCARACVCVQHVVEHFQACFSSVFLASFGLFAHRSLFVCLEMNKVVSVSVVLHCLPGAADPQ